MKLIGNRWNKPHRGSKILVAYDYSFKNMDKIQSTLKKGYYYICGFWGDAMGLSFTKDGFNDIVVPSKALMYFYK